jgi:hypothetical protein
MSSKINKYICQTCAGSIVTVDIDEGVTPFTLNCRATQGCGGKMISEMYRVDQSLKPEFEFYKVTERKLKRMDAATADHCRRGGLLIRRSAG